ncbi:hypothetical protein J6590_014135 [Homalodisca vitripennis]|nr:hypothetical protein J6590_014135 [Homalodisca vitripennis]
MTQEQKSGLSKNSSRVRAAKFGWNQESAVHAELRRQQQAQRKNVLRAAETPLQAQVRSERQATLQAAKRAIEMPEQSQARRIHNAEMQTTRRRNFMHKDWSVFNSTGFQYNIIIILNCSMNKYGSIVMLSNGKMKLLECAVPVLKFRFHYLVNQKSLKKLYC